MIKNMMRLSCVIIGVLVLFLIFVSYQTPNSPEDAWARFEDPNRVVAEDQLADPLILAGEEVVPLLLEKLTDPYIFHGAYIYTALEGIGDPRALPAFEQVLLDRNVSKTGRCRALMATLRIHQPIKREVVLNSISELDCDDINMERVRNGQVVEVEGPNRSYWDALLGYHY